MFYPKRRCFFTKFKILDLNMQYEIVHTFISRRTITFCLGWIKYSVMFTSILITNS